MKKIPRQYTEVDLLKKQLVEETKEKYVLYKRIIELTEELETFKNKGQDLHGPDLSLIHI